ncbi:MAG: hypothetical protein ACJA08_003299 [Cyclobacteriaceae bacterium]|jgi:hypothetical protein
MKPVIMKKQMIHDILVLVGILIALLNSNLSTQNLSEKENNQPFLISDGTLFEAVEIYPGFSWSTTHASVWLDTENGQAKITWK